MTNKSKSSSGSERRTEPNRFKQFLLVLFIIIPQLITFQHGGSIVLDWYDMTMESVTGALESRLFWFCVFLLSIERITYSMVWFFPQKFIKLCYQPWLKYVFESAERTPIKMMEKLFYFNKFTQALSYALYYFTYANSNVSYIDYANLFFIRDTLINIALNLSLWQVVTCFQMLSLGLLLNFSIYQAIGKIGVYYGFKFGYNVPWCHSFPFNVIGAHPQYIGSLLNVFAVQFLLANTELIQNGWILLGVAQVILYGYMAVVEQYC